MNNTARQHDSLLRELNEERAAALARISRTLESLISQLQQARDHVFAASPDNREHAIGVFRELRSRALEYRWYLEVQREAMGMRHHHNLDEYFKIPSLPGERPHGDVRR
jgi:hypothetical protein